MELTTKLITKIIIATVIIRIFCYTIATPITIAAAVVILIIGVGQRRLNDKYPYDITAYLYYLSNNQHTAALAELEDFANACPHYDDKHCLCDKVCPDCPYGHN